MFQVMCRAVFFVRHSPFHRVRMVNLISVSLVVALFCCVRGHARALARFVSIMSSYFVIGVLCHPCLCVANGPGLTWVPLVSTFCSE